MVSGIVPTAVVLRTSPLVEEKVPLETSHNVVFVVCDLPQLRVPPVVLRFSRCFFFQVNIGIGIVVHVRSYTTRILNSISTSRGKKSSPRSIAIARNDLTLTIPRHHLRRHPPSSLRLQQNPSLRFGSNSRSPVPSLAPRKKGPFHPFRQLLVLPKLHWPLSESNPTEPRSPLRQSHRRLHNRRLRLPYQHPRYHPHHKPPAPRPRRLLHLRPQVPDQ